MNRPLALRTVLRFALGVTTGALLLSSGYSVAQDEEEEANAVEEVIVTGSRIKRSNLDSVKPLEIISEATIESTGLNNIGDVLQNITSSDGTGIRPVSTSTNGGDGSNEISLRNLGAGRTLVLVDGRRWVSGASGIVDMNTVPQAMIERVEILKDGASAVYGSDAIAGVINFVTKKDFDGFDLRVMTGEYSKGDGEQDTVSMTWGTTSDRGNTVVNLSYASQGEIMAGDRKRSSVPYWGCKNYPGSGVEANSFICGSAFPPNVRIFDLGLTKIPGARGDSIDDWEAWNNGARYNYAPINYLQLPLERTSAYMYSTYEFSENLRGYIQGTYTKRKSTQQIAEVPLTIGVSGPQWDITTSADSYFNPFGQDLYAMGLRSQFAGPRTYDYDTDVFGVRGGLEGSFDFGGNEYDWEIGYQRNDAQYDSRIYNFINLFNLANGLGPSFRTDGGVLTCGTPGAPIAGCVPFNIFGGADLGLGAGVITEAEFNAMRDYVSYNGVQNQGYVSDDSWITISGPMFETPAGEAAFAIGYETRRGAYYDTPDTLIASGGSSSNFREPTQGSVTVDEMFIEMVIPLLADAPLARELELSLSGRSSDYGASGYVGNDFVTNDPGSPTTYELGLKWRPIEDLLVRATMGETFRAPSVGDLYSGGGESFPQAQDPCNQNNFGNQTSTVQDRCMADGVPMGGSNQPTTQLRSLVGGSPTLLPETGENWTVGFVYTPSQVEGLSLVLDFWSIELQDVITGIGAQSVLNRCYLDGASRDEAFCDLIERKADGSITTVRTASLNSALNKVEGIDFGAIYTMETDGMGSFRFSTDVTYYVTDEFAQTKDSEPFQSFGWYDGAADWRWRANATVDWNYNDWAVTWNIRALDSMKDDCWISVFYIADAPCNNPERTNNFGYDGTEEMRQVTYHDVQVRYEFNENADIFVGGRNIFGTEPPKVFDSFSHGFDMAWDMPGGGYFYGGLNYKF